MFEFLIKYQGYGYILFMFFLVVVLYGYIAHLYKNQKSGVKDYEKYANLALDDDLNSKPIENREEKKKES